MQNTTGIRLFLPATLGASLLISACSTFKSEPSPAATRETATVVADVDNRPFNPDTLYSLLVAEMAGDRQRFDIMLSNYVQQARKTRDPGIVARAAELARYLSAHPVALEMAQLWLELKPNDLAAHHIAMIEQIQHNNLLEATEHAAVLLRAGESSGFDIIGSRAQHRDDSATTEQLIRRFEQLSSEFPQHTPLKAGLALLYQHQGDLETALQYIQAALKSDPDDLQAAATEIRLLQQMDKEEAALNKLGALVDEHPENHRLRVQYARALLQTDLESAQQQFEKLLELAPEDEDLQLTLALVQYERGQLNRAKRWLEQLTDSSGHSSTAHYYLGRIALAQKELRAAQTHFKAVKPGPDYLAAMAQLAELMNTQGQSAAAIDLVRQERTRGNKTADQIQGLYLLEARLFSLQGSSLKALQTLNKALENYPGTVSLLYTRAMLYTELAKLDEAEQDFQRILEQDPNHAGTLNAWGYTLADRNERLQEAHGYISRAYQLSPEDPAILDSMGWVEYRLGNIDVALQLLKKAMKASPDHEIAAHLGEVLWVSGHSEEARDVWQKGLQDKQDSAIIEETMQRLGVKP